MLVIHFTFKPAHNFFFIFVLLCIDIFIFFFRSNTCLMKPEKKRSLWEAANNFFFSKSQSSVLVLAFNYLIRIFFLVQTRQLLFQKTKNTSYALTHFTFPKKRTSASFYFAYLLQSFSCSLSDRRISSFFPRKGTAKKKKKASKKKKLDVALKSRTTHPKSW